MKLDLYKRLHTKRNNTRIGLFLAIKDEYSLEKVLYPASFVHITPSLVFPKVVFVDQQKDMDLFFSSEELLEYLRKNKTYEGEPKYRFHHMDYEKDIPEKAESFDLLLSQYAGFVSQSCKKYLKDGGILVADDTHGDASLAYLDNDYEFLGVYDKVSDKNYTIEVDDLDDFFILTTKRLTVSKEYLEGLNHGIRYYKNPSGYIFRKVGNKGDSYEELTAFVQEQYYQGS